MRRNETGYRAQFCGIKVKSTDPVSAWGCLGIVVALVAAVGGLAFQFCLWSAFGKDIPWYGDAVAGFLAAPVAFPMVVLCWVVRLCGVEAPFFG